MPLLQAHCLNVCWPIGLRGLCCRVWAFAYWPVTLGQLCHQSKMQYENVVMEYHGRFRYSAGQCLGLQTKQKSLPDTILLSNKSITVRHPHVMLTNSITEGVIVCMCSPQMTLTLICMAEGITSAAVVLNFSNTLESTREALKMLMPRLPQPNHIKITRGGGRGTGIGIF